MIESGLGKKYVAKEATEAPSGDFKTIPKGKYAVEVALIEGWTEKTGKVALNKVDASGSVIKVDGKVVREKAQDYKWYGCKMRLKLTGEGEFAGRLVFTHLTTHPNAGFILESFLAAV